MNEVIFATAQGRYLELLIDIFKNGTRSIDLHAVISDSSINKLDNPSFDRINIIKEWEVYQSQITEADRKLVANFEKQELGESLFKAIVIDRRMYFGSRTKVRQSYNPRFSTKELEDKLVQMASVIIRKFDFRGRATPK